MSSTLNSHVNNSQLLHSQVKVLIVEDNESDRAIYRRYIQSDKINDYQFLETDSIKEGINIWRSQSPDVIVLDFDLRDGNGLKLLEIMSEGVIDPKLPVIMLTGYKDGLLAAKAMKLGAADYLIKDEINSVSFCSSIHRLLERISLFRKLERSQQQEALISEIAQHVRQSLELDKIYEAIVQDVKTFLNADRTVIYKFNPSMSGTIVAESVDHPWDASIHANIIDTCFRDNLGSAYREGKIFAANDIYNANLSSCHIQLLERFQVRANLVVPILLPESLPYSNDTKARNDSSLWGLLIVHQCSNVRNWEDVDLRLLQQLSVQLAIALHQAELYQNLQKLNSSLEEKVQQRVTELQDSELKLRHSEDLLRISFDNAPVGMATLNLEGKFLTVNQDICKTYGYSAEELLQLKAVEITHPDSIELTISCLNKLIAGESSSAILEKKYIHKKGNLIEAISRVSLVRDINNDPVQFVVSVEDITEKKQNDAKLAAAKIAEASNKAKSEFLAAMSHEIRTPMNAVIGMAGLLSSTSLSSQQQQFVSGIRQGGEVLLSVINKILDFSQIEAGSIELEEHPFDLRNCIEEMLYLMSSQTAAKFLELSVLIDTEVPQRIIGDSTRLRQVLVNLISNAIKFTERGEIVVTLNSTVVESDSNIYQLNFTVSDTGIGIAPEAISRLFKAFSQADSSITRQYGGTGLGLAICKQLCKLMGGELQVVSEVGKGTTFSFFIRARAIAAEAQAIAPELDKKCILVINDNETTQRAILLYSQEWGMVIQFTRTEVEALKYLELVSFDAILIDCKLLSIDIVGFVSKIQEILPDLPIILMTSIAGIDIPPRLQFSGYLTKPITSSKLYKMFLELFTSSDTQKANSYPSFNVDSNFASKHPFKILVVEDNSVNQQIFLLMLERLGYQGDVVGNGLEAINALERQPYDLVFLDIQMPIMDGLTACQHIRQRSEHSPWIIGLSANAFSESRETALSAGMNDYLTKPLEIEELITTLNRVSDRLKLIKNPVERSSRQISEDLDVSKDRLIEPTKARSDDIKELIVPPNIDFQHKNYATELSVINPSTLAMLEQCISKKALSEIIKSYLAESTRSIAKMRDSLVQLEFEKISFENHSLRGGSGTLGADRLVVICKELSRVCKTDNYAGKSKDVDGVLQQLELEFMRTAQFLQQKIAA
ncbi:MAG: hypothetical protein DCF19_01160 [Pseudanabaena frigida]|uniref:Circadian input-output histidine kinase CikA n=1 Tax=Pseudanabaena frigida TaxID=945775 RepID=A0A2W4WTE4_9CYAN|nr:MAG: hypothetical protein DCF19_01160 [Pseudanabaena frigida]